MKTITAFADEYLAVLRQAVDALPRPALDRAAEMLFRARAAGRTVFVLGNGGSAALGSHFASDLCRAGVRALSLADNVAALTATANDQSYAAVFAELVALQVAPADVVVAISGSGSSPNVLAAVAEARVRGAETLGLIGFDGGPLAGAVDHAVVVAARHYGVVEDLHLTVCHILTMFLAGAERMGHPDRRPPSALRRS